MKWTTIKSGQARAAALCAGWVVACAALAGPPALPAPVVQQEVLVDPNAPEETAPAQPAAVLPRVDPEKVEKGRHMYKDYCQKCHGLNMVSPGGGFFDLRTFPTDEKLRFVSSVTNGKRAMPAWGAVLKADDLELLWAYVSTRGGTVGETTRAAR